MSRPADETLESRTRALVARVGPWRSHNIRLREGVYTRDPGVVGDEIRARRILQIVADIAGRPLEQLRVLDLGCNEGLFAVELALHGATVVGLEGRHASCERARFAAEVLGLGNLEIVQDDVRRLSVEKYGQFDVVLCLGLLYHLDVPDVFEFTRRLAEFCRGFAVIDTHVALAPSRRVGFGGRIYGGRGFVEHRRGSSAAQREELAKASLDNPSSFWLTRPSLYNLLAEVGFTSVHECHNPAYPISPLDRAVFVAFRGRPQLSRAAPLVNALPAARWPERTRQRRSPGHRWYHRPLFLWSELVRSLPAPVRRAGKALLGRRR